MRIGLIVHGGAGLWKEANHAAVIAACRMSVESGRDLLLSGGSALDAVEAAVRVMEADPLFNAGYGSTLTRDGKVEMDALVMEGQKGQIGAIAAVSKIEHPVSLARLVMERTTHHLLVGAGAEQFAAEQDFPLVAPEKMIAPGRLKEYEDSLKSQPVKDGSSDTVGAVALDSSGQLAVAVSTGGLRGKLPGRVGDSPIAGAGGYADNGLGAACATGVGEGIIRSLLTFRAVEALGGGGDAQTAADYALSIFTHRFEGEGGLILIDRYGNVGIAHNTPFMPVAWLSGERILAQVSQNGS